MTLSLRSHRGFRRVRAVAGGIFALALSVAPATGDTGTARAEAESAESAYQRGLEAISGSTAARSAFTEAGDAWSAAIEAGADGPAAWFNLGNARLRAGDLGPAILAYRRAERLAPTDDDIAANLAEARRRVDRPIQADATDVDFSSVAAWWHLVPTQGRLWLAVVAWVAFWIVLDRRRALGGRRPDERESETAAWRTVIVASLAISIVSAATVAADHWLPRWRPVGVLVHADVVLRSGNGVSFEPVVQEPLSEGVEFAILEDRPGWWRVRLPDGTVGWVSKDDGSRV